MRFLFRGSIAIIHSVIKTIGAIAPYVFMISVVHAAVYFGEYLFVHRHYNRFSNFGNPSLIDSMSSYQNIYKYFVCVVVLAQFMKFVILVCWYIMEIIFNNEEEAEMKAAEMNAMFLWIKHIIQQTTALIKLVTHVDDLKSPKKASSPKQAKDLPKQQQKSADNSPKTTPDVTPSAPPAYA
jgi:hypothetical protein